MKKSLIALAFGTLALGMSEFVMMGILPDIARSLGVSIPEAGHLISAYALGVCFGAPLMVLVARKRPLKQILLALTAMIAAGNLCASLAPDYWSLLGLRFVSGLPHGAFFGVGSIVAERVADAGKRTEAVSIMIVGMTVANLFGVPLGTYISNVLTWRATFGIVAVWGVVALLLVRLWVPRMEPLPDTGLKGQFRFLRSLAPWLVLLSVMLGNIIGGHFSDRFTPEKVVRFTLATAAATLLAIYFGAHVRYLSVALMVLCTGCLFCVSSPQQLLILENSRGGEMLGAALVQVAFNLGNALGAYCGGLPIDHGLGYRYTALAGMGFVLLGHVEHDQRIKFAQGRRIDLNHPSFARRTRLTGLELRFRLQAARREPGFLALLLLQQPGRHFLLAPGRYLVQLLLFLLGGGRLFLGLGSLRRLFQQRLALGDGQRIRSIGQRIGRRRSAQRISGSGSVRRVERRRRGMRRIRVSAGRQ